MRMKKAAKDLELLARSTSIKAALDVLKAGTLLWKVRDKGNLRGLKCYCRMFRLSLDALTISYSPNKNFVGGGSCANASADDAAIHLNDIGEVRVGHGTDVFNFLSKGRSRKEMSALEANGGGIDANSWNCFSIIFRDDRPPLDLVAEDNVTRDSWVDALSHLIVTIRSLGNQKDYELYLRKMFEKADRNANGLLTLSECRGLCHQLNVKIVPSTLEESFRKANRSEGEEEEAALDETEFVSFYYGLLRTPDTDAIFFGAARGGGGGRMTALDLCRFMQEEQKVEVPVEECANVVAAYEPSKDRSSLSVEGFTQFLLFSEWQDVVDPLHKRNVYQDMTQPLSHYWMASSHNTYLLGNQVTSDSSVDAYISALKGGCRCVELDCWDGDDDEPVIYHGWTMTSKILFRDVLRDAIVPYAFDASEYPLILSIENHCSVEQQNVMAAHLRTVLGGMLHADPVDGSLDALPSPEDMKRKVLVKAKRLPPGAEEDAELEEEEEDPDEERDEKRKSGSKKISKALSDLVNYVEAVHFPGFEGGNFYQMSSFGESKAFGYFGDPERSVDFVRYNSRQLSRIYPGATRQDSSNFCPLSAWNSGCQIVALNYQTEDKQNFLNRARFADNGGCGYVLKPHFLRLPDPDYSPLAACGAAVSDPGRRTVVVTVVGGQHIPRPDGSLEGDVNDPYVKVRVRGHPDEKPNKAKTSPVKNNGFNPVWNERFRFDVKAPALAFLELRVKDHSKSGSDKDLGAFCCPFSLIQQGYRRAPLSTYGGRSLSPASLLIKIEFHQVE